MPAQRQTRPDHHTKLNSLTTIVPPAVAAFAILLWCLIHLPNSNPVSTPPMSSTVARKILSAAVFNTSLVTAIHHTWFAALPRYATAPTPDMYGRWFGVNQSSEAKDAFDGNCRTLFLPALTSVDPSNYPLPPFTSHDADRAIAPAISAPFRSLSMLKTADEAQRTDAVLAMVLLLDQMPRNIFRLQEAKVVYEHYDRLARALVYCIFHRYTPGELGMAGAKGPPDLYNLHRAESIAPFPVRKSWLLLPLMHSESLDDHLLELKLGEEMRAEAEMRGDTDGAGWAARGLEYEDSHRKILEQFGRYPHRNKVLGRKFKKEEKEWLERGGDTFGTG